jgi:hypothetical protein
MTQGQYEYEIVVEDGVATEVRLWRTDSEEPPTVVRAEELARGGLPDVTGGCREALRIARDELIDRGLIPAVPPCRHCGAAHESRRYCAGCLAGREALLWGSRCACGGEPEVAWQVGYDERLWRAVGSPFTYEVNCRECARQEEQPA